MYVRAQNALVDISAAIENTPPTVEMYCLRAKVHEKLDQLELALHDYDSAVTLSPEDIHLLLARAACHKILDRLIEAIYDYSKGNKLILFFNHFNHLDIKSVLIMSLGIYHLHNYNNKH